MYRPAVRSDLDAVIDLMRRYCAEDNYAFVEAEAHRAVEDLIRDDGLGRLWIARPRLRSSPTARTKTFPRCSR